MKHSRFSTGSKIQDHSNLKPVAKKVYKKAEDFFLFDVIIVKLRKGSMQRTRQKNEWAIQNFKDWCDARNKYPKLLCPDVGLFHVKKLAHKWLCKYLLKQESVTELNTHRGTEALGQIVSR